MKICPHCGKQLKDDAEFCFSCGREQPAVSGASKKERNEKPARESAKAASRTGGAEASVNKRDNRKGIVLVIVTLLLLALIGGTVTYLILSGKDGKGDGDVTGLNVTKAPELTEAPDAPEATELPAPTPDETNAPIPTDAPALTDAPKPTDGSAPTEVPIDAGDFKLGVILLHDESSPYDNNFIIALRSAQTELKLTDDQIIIKRQVPENNECYETARDLVAEGCKVIFADSYGHEDYMIKAAREFKDVQFCHASGVKAHTEKLANYHNAYAAIYDGRYLTGIAAGLKLKDMMAKDPGIVPKVGFVGAFTYEEVISSYTAFYLGIKEIVPAATMNVQFSGSWYDVQREQEAAEALIAGGCVLISQYSESRGAPAACENAGVPNVAYSSFNNMVYPKTCLLNSRINWTPYFKYICAQAIKGAPIDTDWTGTLENGSVELSLVNTLAAAPGTKEVLDQYAAKLRDGSLHVFDTAKFTVEGKHLTSILANVDADPDFKDDTEAIHGGYFHESEYRSAPYFNILIDGITLLNMQF